MYPALSGGLADQMDSDTAQDYVEWSQRLRASDKTAFEWIFNHFYGQLLIYASRILNSKDSAKDIVQEAFITLWNKRENVDPAKSVKSLLYRIVYTRCLNQIRDTRKLGFDTDQLQDVPDKDFNPETELFDDGINVNEILEKIMTKLPERQREAFLMSRQEGLTHEEIADIMDCRPATVNNHITSAMKNLRSYLREMNIEGYQ
jgi:RNA polymerase sigma-70 factor, ECF subfamily